MDLKKLLHKALNTSIIAGQEIMEVYNTEFYVDFKKDQSPLTLADKKSHNAIVSFLQNTNIPILSEEGKETPYVERKRWDFFWLIDPLDGTKEFVKRNGEFTVNIALIHNQKPILGVIYVPVKNDLYFGLADFGAFKKENTPKTITDLYSITGVSDKLPLETQRSTYTIVGSRSHMSRETEEFFAKKKMKYKDVELLTIGSSLKLCMVAEGKADVYPRYAPTMEWDTAAGHAIANAAGFSVTKYDTNKELIYNKENLLNPWFLVS